MCQPLRADEIETLSRECDRLVATTPRRAWNPRRIGWGKRDMFTPFQPHRLLQVLPVHLPADPRSRWNRVYTTLRNIGNPGSKPSPTLHERHSKTTKRCSTNPGQQPLTRVETSDIEQSFGNHHGGQVHLLGQVNVEREKGLTEVLPGHPLADPRREEVPRYQGDHGNQKARPVRGESYTFPA